MLKKVIIAASIFALSTTQLFAGTATATITYSIQSVDAISLSASPGTFTINGPDTPGSKFGSATDDTTTFSVTTNGDPGAERKITGYVQTALPTGVTLAVNLTAPTGGTSQGYVSLTTTAQDLVLGITDVAETKGISYKLTVDLTTAPIGDFTNAVIYTFGV